jgi:hypothetical protein
VKIEDLTKAVEAAYELLVKWWSCISAPTKTAEEILDLAASPADAVRRALPVWAVAFVLSVILTGWVYQLYGIGMGNVTFLLAQSTLLLVLLFSGALSLHFSLKLHRLPSSFHVVFVVWTVFTSAFAPIVSVLASPLLALTVAELQIAKKNGVSLVDAAAQLFTLVERSSNQHTVGLALAAVILIGPLTFTQSARAFDFLAQTLPVDRRRLFSAGAFGLLLGVIPLAPVSALNHLIIYAFL